MSHKGDRGRKRTDRCGPTGKVRYRTKGQAEERGREIVTGKNPFMTKFRTYECSFCGGYHLTSQV